MEKSPTSKRYDEKTKKKVAEAIAAGKMTVSEARKKYSITGGMTIKGWLKKYAPDALESTFGRAKRGRPAKAAGKKGAGKKGAGKKGAGKKGSGKKGAGKKGSGKKGAGKKGGKKGAARKAAARGRR